MRCLRRPTGLRNVGFSIADSEFHGYATYDQTQDWGFNTIWRSYVATSAVPSSTKGVRRASISRHPRSLQALYLKPLRREAVYGIPSCDLQLRSFSIQPLEFFTDFALRAAYYLGLPAYGPIPLPCLRERWTVPRSHFIFKKSQENFERFTHRRMIQIKDANTVSVQLWLAYLRKHQYYGVGMKANLWEFTGVGKNSGSKESMAGELPDRVWMTLGRVATVEVATSAQDILSERHRDDIVGLKRGQRM